MVEFEKFIFERFWFLEDFIFVINYDLPISGLFIFHIEFLQNKRFKERK